MRKGIVMIGCKNGVVANNRIYGDFDVGIEIDNCENINTYGNDINVGSHTQYHPSFPIMKKIGRNEKCPCGSGLKYKRCCGG